MLEHAISSWGLRGLKLDPALQQFDLSSKTLLSPLLEVLQQTADPGFGSLWAELDPIGMAGIANPLLLESAIQSFPDVNLCSLTSPGPDK